MSDQIDVISRTQVIIVEPTYGTVSIINSGPQGPAGPSGGVGDSVWEVLAGELHPIDNPTVFIVTTDSGGSINFNSGGNFLVVADFGATITTEGDITIHSNDDIHITTPDNIEISGTTNTAIYTDYFFGSMTQTSLQGQTFGANYDEIVIRGNHNGSVAISLEVGAGGGGTGVVAIERPCFYGISGAAAMTAVSYRIPVYGITGGLLGYIPVGTVT